MPKNKRKRNRVRTSEEVASDAGKELQKGDAPKKYMQFIASTLSNRRK